MDNYEFKIDFLNPENPPSVSNQINDEVIEPFLKETVKIDNSPAKKAIDDKYKTKNVKTAMCDACKNVFTRACSKPFSIISVK